MFKYIWRINWMRNGNVNEKDYRGGFCKEELKEISNIYSEINVKSVKWVMSYRCEINVIKKVRKNAGTWEIPRKSSSHYVWKSTILILVFNRLLFTHKRECRTQTTLILNSFFISLASLHHPERITNFKAVGNLHFFLPHFLLNFLSINKGSIFIRNTCVRITNPNYKNNMFDIKSFLNVHPYINMCLCTWNFV